MKSLKNVFKKGKSNQHPGGVIIGTGANGPFSFSKKKLIIIAIILMLVAGLSGYVYMQKAKPAKPVETSEELSEEEKYKKEQERLNAEVEKAKKDGPPGFADQEIPFSE